MVVNVYRKNGQVDHFVYCHSKHPSISRQTDTIIYHTKYTTHCGRCTLVNSGMAQNVSTSTVNGASKEASKEKV